MLYYIVCVHLNYEENNMHHQRFCLWREVVCIETRTMTFTLIWDSQSLHGQWFSPLIWIQEKVLCTENGLSLKSDFTKKVQTQTIPLPFDDLIYFQQTRAKPEAARYGCRKGGWGLLHIYFTNYSRHGEISHV